MTREEQIEKLKNFLNFKVQENGGWYRVEDIVDCVLKWADDNPKSPWISVEDGLPTNQKQKIIMRKRTGKCYCGWFDTSLNYFTTIDPSFTKWTINGVTHWMPIPELPKGE